MITVKCPECLEEPWKTNVQIAGRIMNSADFWGINGFGAPEPNKPINCPNCNAPLTRPAVIGTQIHTTAGYYP